VPRLTSVRDGVRRAARTYALPLAILGIGWMLVVAYAHPGLMTQDSFDHLKEARSGVYTDGHPPSIVALWRMIDKVIPGPFGMLALQLTAFQVGLYLIFRRTFSRTAAAIAATVVLVFPPVMMPMAVVWKDCLMAGFLVLGIGGLLGARRSVKLGGLVALMLASAFRYNAFAATLPAVVLLFEWRPGMHWLRRYAIALMAWLAITFTAFTINAALTDKQMHVWHSSLAVYDIVGTLAFVDHIPDSELEQTLASTGLLVHDDIHASIRIVYSPRDFFPILTHPRRALWNLPIYGLTPAPKEQRDAIARAWWNVLTSHPLAYIEHRLTVMTEVLCLGRVRKPEVAVTRREYGFPTVAHSLGISTEWAPYQLTATRWMQFVWRNTPIFVPWIYLVLALVMLPLTRKNRDVFALLASGLIFESSLLVLAPSPDYRYSHWMVICTVIAVIVLTARRFRAARAQPA
jgi:hypothetical protein